MPADVEVVESPTATPTAVATPPVAPDEGVEVRYEVRWGDTLTAIARRYGTTVEAIRARNPEITDPHRVHAGSVLIIPSSARVDPGSVTTPPATQEHIIQRGDTLSAIASRYGTTVQALMQANPWITNPSYIEAGRCLVIQSGTGATAPVVHVVRAGETLTAIARLYNTTIWAIVVRNNLVNPSFIYAGQRLIIP
jgi:LysM repeat protein